MTASATGHRIALDVLTERLTRKGFKVDTNETRCLVMDRDGGIIRSVLIGREDATPYVSRSAVEDLIYPRRKGA